MEVSVKLVPVVRTSVDANQFLPGRVHVDGDERRDSLDLKGVAVLVQRDQPWGVRQETQARDNECKKKQVSQGHAARQKHDRDQRTDRDGDDEEGMKEEEASA